MSPCLNYQIARAHQAEIASRAQQVQQARHLRHTGGPGRSVRARVSQTVVTLSAYLSATAGFASH